MAQTSKSSFSQTYRLEEWPPSSSLMNIPGELRNRICDFVFQTPHQPDDKLANLSNGHLLNHFNLLLCAHQLRREQFEKLFVVDRFFQDFEALDAWVCKGNTISPGLLPHIRHVGIQTGRTRRRPECRTANNDFHLQRTFSKLPGLRTLHVSSPHTLRSFVMNIEEISEIMVSVSKACPSLERLAFLVPSENLNFLYNLPNLQSLAITTPTFFDADHFVAAVSALPNLSAFRIRDKGCSSAFTPSILRRMPPLQKIQLKDDTTPSRVVTPEMMNALLERHGATITSLHLEVSKSGWQGTLRSIFVSLPQLPRLARLELWYDRDRREDEAFSSLLFTLPLLPGLKYLHLCFKLPEHMDSELIYQKIMNALQASGSDAWLGEHWINEEGHVLIDANSEWARDGNMLKNDELYGAAWPPSGRNARSGKGTYHACMQVRAWR